MHVLKYNTADNIKYLQGQILKWFTHINFINIKLLLDRGKC